MRQERLIDTCRNKKTQTNETYWLFRHIWSNRQSDQRNIKKRPRWHLHLDGEEITRAITVCKMCRKRFVFWEKETYKRELKGIQTYVTSRAIALRTCRLTCQACQTRPTDMNRNQHKRPGDKTWKRDQQTWKKDQQTRKRDQQKWKRDLQTRKRDLQTWKRDQKTWKRDQKDEKKTDTRDQVSIEIYVHAWAPRGSQCTFVFKSLLYVSFHIYPSFLTHFSYLSTERGALRRLNAVWLIGINALLLGFRTHIPGNMVARLLIFAPLSISIRSLGPLKVSSGGVDPIMEGLERGKVPRDRRRQVPSVNLGNALSEDSVCVTQYVYTHMCTRTHTRAYTLSLSHTHTSTHTHSLTHAQAHTHRPVQGQCTFRYSTKRQAYLGSASRDPDPAPRLFWIQKSNREGRFTREKRCKRD